LRLLINCFSFMFLSQLQFDLFSIEESQDCKYDYLNVVFNASSSSAAPKRYTAPASGMLNFNTLVLNFALLINS